MTADRWYIYLDGDVRGPFTPKKLAQFDQLDNQTKVTPEDAENWQALEKRTELASTILKIREESDGPGDETSNDSTTNSPNVSSQTKKQADNPDSNSAPGPANTSNTQTENSSTQKDLPENVQDSHGGDDDSSESTTSTNDSTGNEFNTWGNGILYGLVACTGIGFLLTPYLLREEIFSKENASRNGTLLGLSFLIPVLGFVTSLYFVYLVYDQIGGRFTVGYIGAMFFPLLLIIGLIFTMIGLTILFGEPADTKSKATKPIQKTGKVKTIQDEKFTRSGFHQSPNISGIEQANPKSLPQKLVIHHKL